MGNTNSQSYEESAYNDYLNQQKKIIMAQQEQINNLTKLNIRQNIINQQKQNIPSNIMFKQNQQNQQIPINNQQNQQIPNQNLHQIENKKNLDPYKILNLNQNFDETSLKKAYIRMAVKTHPDKGGNVDDFQKVSIAYTILLKKLNDKKNNNDHNTMKNNHKHHSNENNSLKNVKLSENFDCNLFNKVYEENRIENIYDNGYNQWMKKNQIEENNNQEKMFNGKFNKNMFHKEFDNYKKNQQSKLGNHIIKFEEPINNISYKGRDQLMILGQDKINDFSGNSGDGLSFRDYRDAFTNTCLIDTNTQNIKNRARNINDIQNQRSNIQYQMNDDDIRKQQYKKNQDETNEQLRLERLRNNDNQSFDLYNKVHQRMIGN